MGPSFVILGNLERADGGLMQIPSWGTILRDDKVCIGSSESWDKLYRPMQDSAEGSAHGWPSVGPAWCFT